MDQLIEIAQHAPQQDSAFQTTFVNILTQHGKKIYSSIDRCLNEQYLTYTTHGVACAELLNFKVTNMPSSNDTHMVAATTEQIRSLFLSIPQVQVAACTRALNQLSRFFAKHLLQIERS